MSAAASHRHVDRPTGTPQDAPVPGNSRLHLAHLTHRHDGTHVVTDALPSATADRALRDRRYVISQTLRLCCFLAATLLPLPLPARLALIAASVALSWAAVVAANAGPARVRRRVPVALVPTPGTRGGHDAQPGPRYQRESLRYRLRWNVAYALLQVYGPAQLGGDADPRTQMLVQRAAHRLPQAAPAALPPVAPRRRQP